jgi:hypothetical protein
VSCGSNTANKPASNSDTVKPPAVTPDSLTANTPTLDCLVLPEDSMGIPHSILYLISNGKKITVDTIYSCAEMIRSEYEKNKIPADAIIALGGWWAGSGDYYYLVVRGGKPVLYAGWQDEQQTDEGYHWEEKKLDVE